MYTPKQFQPADDKIVKEFISQNSFGTLVTHSSGQLWATHLPMLLSSDETKLSGHVSRGNKTWKHFQPDLEVMTIFQGAHTYISSSWYDHENVPTWNYIAAHVYGSIRIIEGDELLESLKMLTNKYEKQSENPVSVEKLSPDYVRRQVQAIVGFEITINRIEASFKLSQNRDAKNYQSVISALEKRGDHDSLAIAREMKNNESKIFSKT
jgi:transcriptional regulator